MVKWFLLLTLCYLAGCTVTIMPAQEYIEPLILTATIEKLEIQNRQIEKTGSANFDFPVRKPDSRGLVSLQEIEPLSIPSITVDLIDVPARSSQPTNIQTLPIESDRVKSSRIILSILSAILVFLIFVSKRIYLANEPRLIRFFKNFKAAVGILRLFGLRTALRHLRRLLPV